MTRFVPARKYLPFAFAALVTAGASPALAKTVYHTNAQSSQPLYLYAPNAGSVARVQAIHDCSVKAAPISFLTSQTAQITTYRTCMFEHGQQE